MRGKLIFGNLVSSDAGAESDGLTGRRPEAYFHLFINCLQRPRNLTVAVECSATQGHAKQRSYIFVYTYSTSQVASLGPFDEGDGSSYILVARVNVSPRSLPPGVAGS